MQKEKFVSGLFILTGILAMLIALFQLAQQRFMLSNFIWPSLLYFFALSYITWRITRSGIKKDNKTFVTRVYSAIGIRLMFSFFPIIFYVLFSDTTEMVFVIAYLLLYFFYTTFEIYALVVNLRPDSNKNSGS